MQTAGVSKYTTSFGISLALASVVNGLLVIAKEKNPAVLDGMKHLTGHHWVTHCVVILALFAVVGWLLARLNGGQGIRLTVSRLITTLLSGVILGGLLIVGFYLLGD